MFNKQIITILEGNIKDIIQNIPEVHCIITSPPYYKQRKYGKNSLEIGRETTIENYINNLCEIFNGIKLHERGSLWVNIGDKRNTNGGLFNIPHKFVEEMLSHGWLLADSVVWAKVVDYDDGSTVGGCMTEPAHGRLNANGYEMIYRFVKTARVNQAWSDTCAVRIPRQGIDNIPYLPKELISIGTSVEGRNLHNVWRINMGQTKQKHYAAYTKSLCERGISMTCPIYVNPDNSLPERIVEMEEYEENRGSKRIFGKYTKKEDADFQDKSGRQDSGQTYIARKPVTKGWTFKDDNASLGIVLDPFCGTGTTGDVAIKLGRSFMGVDLYNEYCEITKERCSEAQKMLLENNYNPWELMR